MASKNRMSLLKSMNWKPSAMRRLTSAESLTGMPLGLPALTQPVRKVCKAASWSGWPAATPMDMAKSPGPRKPISMPSTLAMASAFSMPLHILDLRNAEDGVVKALAIVRGQRDAAARADRAVAARWIAHGLGELFGLLRGADVGED